MCELTSSSGRVSVEPLPDAVVIRDPIFGDLRIGDRVVRDLLAAPAVARLKGVHQGGASYLVKERRDLSRYDHSVGVMLGLRALGTSLDEQVAGLLHDISHTAFSHVVDRALLNEGDDFHEHALDRWVRGTEIPGLLGRHGYDWSRMMDGDRWPLLEQAAPDLCMDRVDYTLRDLLHAGKITSSRVTTFVAALGVHNGRLTVRKMPEAVWFAEQYHREVADVFMDPVEAFANAALGEAVRVALEQRAITWQDLFLEDDELLARLRSTGLPPVTETLRRLRRGLMVADSSGADDGSLRITHKRRIVDPLVEVRPGVVQRSSELDARVAEWHRDIDERVGRQLWLKAISHQ
jgi:HD superfamily phosphohydrolase